VVVWVIVAVEDVPITDVLVVTTAVVVLTLLSA
jgi:hypothetical protein